MKYSLGISNFVEEVSSLFHFTVFLHFFALITEEGFLISPDILWNSAFKWAYLTAASIRNKLVYFKYKSWKRADENHNSQNTRFTVTMYNHPMCLLLASILIVPASKILYDQIRVLQNHMHNPVVMPI